MSEWLNGVKGAEQHVEQWGCISYLADHLRDEYGSAYVDGWNDYVRNTAYAKALDQIERDYCHAVVNVSYATHTELEVLGILQKLQDKRRQDIQNLQRKFINQF